MMRGYTNQLTDLSDCLETPSWSPSLKLPGKKGSLKKNHLLDKNIHSVLQAWQSLMQHFHRILLLFIKFVFIYQPAGGEGPETGQKTHR